MPKQTLLQRVIRLVSDAAADESVDLHARWQKIVDDGPGAAAEAALGKMPVPTLPDIPIADAVAYAGRDPDATLRVYPILADKIAQNGLERALALDVSVSPMIAAMCHNGLLVDTAHLKVLDEVFQDNLYDVEAKIYKEVGRRFSITSGDQVAEVLFDDLGLDSKRRTKSGKRLSTDEKALQALQGQHSVIPLLLEHREISKLQGTYVHKLPECISPDGRIRMELGMSTVPSGRLNCWGGVNLLAIPVRTELGREIRRCFIAPLGCRLGSIDLNQIELRALAILSGDEAALSAFKSGQDLHKLTASALFKVPFESVSFEQRQRGKTINFAIANQISASGLLDQFIVSGIGAGVDVADCDAMLSAWFKKYNKVQPWFESVYEEGRRNGYIRDPLSGRIMHCPGLRSPIEKVESEAKRVATNWCIQTFAQVIIKMGMAALWETLPDPGLFRYLLQVHDEILLEDHDGTGVDYSDALIEIITGAAPPLPIPIVAACHWAESWAELK